MLVQFTWCVVWIGLLCAGRASAATSGDPSQFFEAIVEDERTPYENFLASQDYDKNIFLSTTSDPSDGMAVFWKIRNVQNLDEAVTISRRDSSTYGLSLIHI